MWENQIIEEYYIEKFRIQSQNHDAKLEYLYTLEKANLPSLL